MDNQGAFVPLTPSDNYPDTGGEQWRELSRDERQAFKGVRWLLFKHVSKRSPEDQTLIDQLRKGNRRIHRACVLKDEFNLFWDFSNKDKAKDFLKRWGLF